MNKDDSIRNAQNRYVKIIEKQPHKAVNTYRATAVIEEGLTCRFTQGERSAVMDMPKTMGGDEAGPTPGFFARAGIAGCVSMGIKQTAVMAGLALRSVTVEVETDFDDGATLGLGPGNAAPLDTRLRILIDTDVPKAEIAALVDKALAIDPWFLALRDAQSVGVDVVLTT